MNVLKTLIIVIMCTVTLIAMIYGQSAQAIIVYKSDLLQGIFAQGHYAGCISFLNQAHCYRELSIFHKGIHIDQFFTYCENKLTRLAGYETASGNSIINVLDNIIYQEGNQEVQTYIDKAIPEIESIVSSFILKYGDYFSILDNASESETRLTDVFHTMFGGIIYVSYANEIVNSAKHGISIFTVNFLPIILGIGVFIIILSELLSLKFHLFELVSIIVITLTMSLFIVHNAIITNYFSYTKKMVRTVNIFDTIYFQKFATVNELLVEDFISDPYSIFGLHFKPCVGVSLISFWIASISVLVAWIVAASRYCDSYTETPTKNNSKEY